MQINCKDRIQGFLVERIVPVPELSGTLYQMVFEKNGARLAYLERRDENQTFLIGFQTLPADDTGVFHILEHSVLDGSERYPMKAPIIELLKRSLQTDLNAMTSTDFTSYYCCSRNKKDFLNLIDVYLDAVFHPLSIKESASFLQEGWHYELDEDGELDVNGVVYNEMKTSAGSWRFLMERSLDRQLFSDTCYQYVAGGVPEEMPSLTYEQYRETYGKCYHPSNSWIFLDGQLDLPKVLSHIRAVLDAYEDRRPEPANLYQKPHLCEETVDYYELAEEESEENRAVFAREWIFGDWREKEKISAFCLLRDVLFGSNEAPVPKALYDRGLCQNLYFRVDSSCCQSTVTICMRNADPERKEEAWQTLYDCLAGIVREGINREYLDACLNTYEFNWREQGSSERPRGVVYGMNVMESWVYGGDPEWNLNYNDVFSSLREKIKNGWFEKLLSETILENPYYASALVLPSRTIGESREDAWRVRMQKKIASWDQDMIRKIRRQEEELLIRQEEPVPEEKMALLPRLSLKDIPAEEEPVPNEVTMLGNVVLLHQNLPTNGICYVKAYFDCSDLSLEQIQAVDFLIEMYGNLPTCASSPMELRKKMDACLGSFEVSIDMHRRKRSRTDAELYVVVESSFLEAKRDQALELIREILFESRFEEQDKIARRLTQRRKNKETSVLRAGSGLALSLAERNLSRYHDLEDACESLRFLRWLQKTDDSFDEQGAALTREFQKLMRKILTRSRLTLSITGRKDPDWLTDFLDLLPEGEKAVHRSAGRGENCWEVYETTADVSATAMILDLTSISSYDPMKYMGAAQVAAQILTYEYLWNEVREKSGAYDVGMNAFLDGTFHLSSSSDPNPVHTIETYLEVGHALRTFAQAEPVLDDYIISVIGEQQGESDPRYDGIEADTNYLCMVDPAEEKLEREQILATTHKELLELADYLDACLASSAVCVLGPEKQAGQMLARWPGKVSELIPILETE